MGLWLSTFRDQEGQGDLGKLEMVSDLSLSHNVENDFVKC